MSQDDLPPPKGHPEEQTFGASLGGLFGASIWIALIFAIAGALVYALIHWMT
jgi:hypothetical protein